MNDKLLLTLLRWDVDCLVYLGEYNTHYWLKPAYNKQSERIGITSCCPLNFECRRHSEIRKKTELQNSANN